MEQAASYASNVAFTPTVTPKLAEFIATQNSRYLASANAAGQPYIQHRGGPPGFLKVIDERTLSFRLALPVEQHALEDLQRRASLMWEEDRAALLDNSEAIELPMDQITNGRTIVAERMGKTVGIAVPTRFRPGIRMRKVLV